MVSIKGSELYAYEIKVDEHLSPSRTGEFEGFLVTSLPEGQTLITGMQIDQSALFGVLIRIRDMGLALISVTRNPLRDLQTDNLQSNIEKENSQ